jgi:hypothetical protein
MSRIHVVLLGKRMRIVGGGAMLEILSCEGSDTSQKAEPRLYEVPTKDLVICLAS